MMMMEFNAALMLAVAYGFLIGLCLMHFSALSRKDVADRYADPKEWRLIWMILIPGCLLLWMLIAVFTGSVLSLLGSLFWIVVVYAAAKIPAIKIMGGQDARVLITAGMLFPHWLTIPVAFCSGLLMAVLFKKRIRPEVQEDWKVRGMPMVPFFVFGWVVSAIIFDWVLFLF